LRTKGDSGSVAWRQRAEERGGQPTVTSQGGEWGRLGPGDTRAVVHVGHARAKREGRTRAAVERPAAAQGGAGHGRDAAALTTVASPRATREGRTRQRGKARGSDQLRPAGRARLPNPIARPGTGTERPAAVTANTEPATETRSHARKLKHEKNTAPARLRLNHKDYRKEGTKGCP
jgi:hypothetical protein